MKRDEVKNKSKLREEIKFEEVKYSNLSFSYTDKEFLNNINLTINKGEFVGIIGESARGKLHL